jgi:hypothetical protein
MVVSGHSHAPATLPKEKKISHPLDMRPGRAKGHYGHCAEEWPSVLAGS